MIQNDDHFKVVFLIDVRRWSSDNHESILQNCTASVRLCVLKLLTYFAHGSAGQPTHLRWGYKFFNSIDVPPCKREILKEFTESNVDYFEEQLLQEFQSATTHPKIVRSEPKSKKKKPAVTTGDSVRHTLSDIFQFQWEGPDISSPVKGVASSKSIAGRTRNQAAGTGPVATNEPCRNSSKPNFVFLLMPCPHHQSDEMEFFGITDEKKMTGFSVQEFRDYIAPVEGGLPEKLKQSKIELFWIDTTPLHFIDQVRFQFVLFVLSGDR